MKYLKLWLKDFDFDNILLDIKMMWKYFDLGCFIQNFDWCKTFTNYVS